MTEPTPTPLLIEDTNLSRAWGRIVQHVLAGSGKKISPLIVSLTGFSPTGEVQEDHAVRAALDEALAAEDFWDIDTVAFTIFPERYWRLAQGDRKRLFEIYDDAAPRLQAMNPRNNRRGLYFERLTRYGAGPCNGNQLEWILQQHASRTGVRQSMYQATTFDPARDHIPDAQLGFPCLQHVSFVPASSGLIMNAFYATQQLFDKAYGNYLGLCQLGAFMAHEMSMPLARLNVTVGVAKLERITKNHPILTPIMEAVQACANSNHKEARPAAANE